MLFLALKSQKLRNSIHKWSPTPTLVYFTYVFLFEGTTRLRFIYKDLISFLAGENPLLNIPDGLKMEYLHESDFFFFKRNS